MKMAAIFITILSLLFSTAIMVSADSNPKDVEVILSDTPAVVNIGEMVALTATTHKHGSTYFDSWENASNSVTKYDLATESYVSRSSFTADKPGIYTISYTIAMTAGDSGNVFYKKVHRTIKVLNPIKVVGAVVKDLTLTPVYNAEGNICLYRASGTVHSLWSDTTTTPANSSVHFFFGVDETSKDVNVTLNIDGVQYNYTVTVNR